MNPKALLLGLGALAVGAVAFTSNSNAAPANSQSPGVGGTGFPPDLATKMQQALDSGDPAKMRTVADEVEKRGYPGQAASLRTAAAAIDAVITSTPPVATIPASMPPGTSVPGIGTVSVPSIPAVNDAATNLAAQVALNIQSSPKGGENKSLVSAYQSQEAARKYYVGNIDGLYGPKTALAMARDQKIVPPTPSYWPKKNIAGGKADYKAQLLTIAATDTPRAEEWAAAANAVV